MELFTLPKGGIIIMKRDSLSATAAEMLLKQRNCNWDEVFRLLMVVSSNTHMSLEDQAELVKGYYIEKFDTDECKYVDWIKIVTCMRKISNVSNCYPEEKQLV